MCIRDRTNASGQLSEAFTANTVAGAYTVTATASGAAGAASFSLTNVALVSIAVSPGNPELAVGVAGQFTATATYADGSTGDITPYVTWASSTPSVATISGTGVATALAPGTSAVATPVPLIVATVGVADPQVTKSVTSPVEPSE